MKHLILRNCSEDGTSRNGFQWDTEIGAVNIAPDFDPIPECGQGLHGWLGGEGNASISSYNNSLLWLVLSVEKYIDLGDKVKFETCTVVFKGTKAECAKYIYDNGGEGKKIIGLTGRYSLGGDLSVLDGGDGSTQTAGYRSTQTAGDESTQKAGDESTQKAGDESTQTAGYGSTQTAGYGSTQTAGYGSTQKAGNKSTQKAGDYSTQTAGYGSTQTAGDYSTQTAGYGSTHEIGDYSNVITGDGSKVKAGIGTVIIHRWELNTKTFTIGSEEADKWFEYKNGEQIKI